MNLRLTINSFIVELNIEEKTFKTYKNDRKTIFLNNRYSIPYITCKAWSTGKRSKEKILVAYARAWPNYGAVWEQHVIYIWQSYGRSPSSSRTFKVGLCGKGNTYCRSSSIVGYRLCIPGRQPALNNCPRTFDDNRAKMHPFYFDW